MRTEKVQVGQDVESNEWLEKTHSSIARIPGIAGVGWVEDELSFSGDGEETSGLEEYISSPIITVWFQTFAQYLQECIGADRYESASSLVVIGGLDLTANHFNPRTYLAFSEYDCKEQEASLPGNILSTVIYDEVKHNRRAVTESKKEQRITHLLNNGCQVFYIPKGKTISPFVKNLQTGNSVWIEDIKPVLLSTIKRLASKHSYRELQYHEQVWCWIKGCIGAIDPCKERAVMAWLKTINFAKPTSQAQLDILAKLVDFNATNAKPQQIAPRPAEPQTIEEIPGLAANERQALIRFKNKLFKPASLDSGLFLTGASGVGKTMIARILANSSKRKLIIGSCSEWAKAGSLSSHLSAMDACFQQAETGEPSFMFIDEIDSLGSRTFADHNKNYNTQIINAFLEKTDGIKSRGDIVLAAASNMPENCDPALLRSGRLGNLIAISNADLKGLADIVRYYMPKNIPIPANLHDIISRISGSNADVVGLVKDATSGLDQSKPVLQQTVEKAFDLCLQAKILDKNSSRVLPATSIAIVSRALIANIAWGNELNMGTLSVLAGVKDYGRVSLAHITGSFPNDSAADVLAEIYVELAGQEAQKQFAALLVEKNCDGYQAFTKDEVARLPKARKLAINFVKLTNFSTSSGLPLKVSEEISAEKIISKARAFVRKILKENFDGLVMASERLMAEGTMDKQRFLSIVNQEYSLH